MTSNLKRNHSVKPVDLYFGKRLNFAKKQQVRDSSHGTQDSANDRNTDDSDLLNEKLRRKQTEFNKKLRREPKNIELWINFVEFQDELNNLFKGKMKRKLHRLIERKVFILRKAFEMNSESLKLILLLLKTAEESNDLTSMLKLWDTFLKAKKGSLLRKDFELLTLEYLKFRQRTFLAFNFEHVNEAFCEVFKIHKEASINFLILLYAEYFRFLKRSGYQERIVSLSQIVIEVCIETWKCGSIDLDAYEDLWDFGLMSHAGDESLRAVNYYSDLLDNFVTGRFLKWAQMEKYRESIHWHPLHNDDDSEGKVIFDDLRDFLIIPTERNDILLLVKAVFDDLGIVFGVHCRRIQEIDFIYWYINIYKALIPFYKNDDWQFILNYFLLHHRFEPLNAETFGKQLLSQNRDCLHLFMAYGRFQELIGNFNVSSKVYEALKRRSCKFNDIISSFQSTDKIELVRENETDSDLTFSESKMKIEVYEMLRSNPGDKQLMIQIIEAVAEKDEQLAKEVYNLIVEQQLRQHTFLEEVGI